MGYNPRKRPEIAENTSFVIPAGVVYRGSQGIEILTGVENDQKWPETRVLLIPLESCTGDHWASKFSRDSKIMGYNPRKRPEMAENTSFADPSRDRKSVV